MGIQSNSLRNSRDGLGEVELSTDLSDTSSASRSLLESHIQTRLMYKPSVVHVVGAAIRHRKFKLLRCRRVSSEDRLLLWEWKWHGKTNLVPPENTGDKLIHLQNRDVLT